MYSTGISEDHACTDTKFQDTPSIVSSIHITMTTKCLDEFGYSLLEVEAYGPDEPRRNLIIGGTAQASSEQDGFPAEGAIDGALNTRWGSSFAEKESWIRIGLPTPQNVTCVVLTWERACAKQYEVKFMPQE
jgi:hypothetical protein